VQHKVPLRQLPDGLQVPAPLAERVHYDAEQQTLAFDGFMTKCRFDELNQLSADPAYRRALEELFVLSSEEVVPQPQARGLWIGVATVAAALLVTLSIWAIWKWPGARHAAGAQPTVNQPAVNQHAGR
jgi:hypothetical protein